MVHPVYLQEYRNYGTPYTPWSTVTMVHPVYLESTVTMVHPVYLGVL